ncbi:hypothetical protein F5Y16DRAFT_409027 [Xylariaceae sp. FL0255]|nr:hypothetical protein F5Y16DRAFT_409027 [Xylariaceae sp. FL0255]
MPAANRDAPEPEAATRVLGGNSVSKPPAARKKVRKGTRSCWECRRRKMKCIFDSPSDDTCTRCTRRGAKCVGQEHPEVVSSPLDRSLQMGDRIVRVEALIDQLLKQVSDNPRESSGFHILDQGLYPSLPGTNALSPFHSMGYESLSLILYDALPSQEDINIICKASGDTSTLFYKMNTHPYGVLEEITRNPNIDSNSTSLASLFQKPAPNAHPVIIARHMLYLATALQHLHPDFHGDVRGLSEPPRAMTQRLVDLATKKVTSRDELIDSVEGLDCVIIESWFHANAGDLRRALLTIRRAITITQVMGFHRAGHGATGVQFYPELLWFRIVAVERYLCLMLGVPQVTLDKSMASEEMLTSDTPMSRLDRIHCAIASRVLERNHQTGADSGSNPSDGYALTRELDEELRKASRALPSGWWLAPNLAAGIQKPESLFWFMRQLFHQLFHYSLLIQLHLPYMLRSSSPSHPQRKIPYEYSWVTCMHSSREILSRLIMFHSYNRVAFSCRTVDFFGLMAAIMLLIAHIDGRRRLSPALAESLLSHQRPCDRALIEQARDKIEDVRRLDEDDVMSVQCSNLLRRLLAMETNEIGPEPPTERDDGTGAGAGAVRLSIPYFGLVDITPRGLHLVFDCSHPCWIQTQGLRWIWSAKPGLHVGQSSFRCHFL